MLCHCYDSFIYFHCPPIVEGQPLQSLYPKNNEVFTSTVFPSLSNINLSSTLCFSISHVPSIFRTTVISNFPNIIIIFISILKIYNNFPLQAVEIYSYYIHTNGREYPSTLIHSNLLKRGLVIHNRDSQHTCLIEKSPSINLFSIFLFVQLSFTQRYLSRISSDSHNTTTSIPQLLNLLPPNLLKFYTK